MSNCPNRPIGTDTGRKTAQNETIFSTSLGDYIHSSGRRYYLGSGYACPIDDYPPEIPYTPKPNIVNIGLVQGQPKQQEQPEPAMTAEKLQFSIDDYIPEALKSYIPKALKDNPAAIAILFVIVLYLILRR